MNKVEELFKELGYRKEYPMEDWYKKRIKELEEHNDYLTETISNMLLRYAVEEQQCIQDNRKRIMFGIDFLDIIDLTFEEKVQLVMRELIKIMKKVGF